MPEDRNMSCNGAVLSSLVTLDTKPLPFLLLPAELRNRVYQYLTQSSNRIVQLKRTSNTNGTWDMLVFANSNKQLRAERRPFIFDKFTVKFFLPDYLTFMDTSHGFGNPLLRIILFMPRDLGTSCTMDLRPVLLAKAMIRGLQIDIARTPHQTHSDIFAAVLGSLVRSPPGFLRDVKSGYITKMTIRHDEYGNGAFWKITIAKKAGGLTPAEVAKCTEYRRLLNNGYFVGHVTFEVADLTGKHVEEWFDDDRALSASTLSSSSRACNIRAKWMRSMR